MGPFSGKSQGKYAAPENCNLVFVRQLVATEAQETETTCLCIVQKSCTFGSGKIADWFPRKTTPISQELH
jgi:hypothetical protein